VGVQEVRWDTGGTIRAGDFIVFYVKGNKTINWEQDFLYITKQYHPLRQQSLLVTGCHIYSPDRSLL